MLSLYLCAFLMGPAAPSTELAAARGGLRTADGLYLSLAIAREVRVNGALQVAQSFQLRDIAGQSAWQGQLPTALLVQNSLDGQSIQASTRIDASSNSMGLLANLNFQHSLQGALALGVH